MPYLNEELLGRIPGYLEKDMKYYPDILLYQLNQAQYSSMWERLSSSKYLYTDGYVVRKTNWFMKVFQSFKGWLGFENHCHPEKISYNLNKLAYYGYTQRFRQPSFSLASGHSLSAEIRDLVVKDYDDATTAQLQRTLVNAYFRVEPHLALSTSDYGHRPNANHRFGDSWITINAWMQVPLLDPQDESLINEVIHHVHRRDIQPNQYIFLDKSQYARLAAQYYCSHAKSIIPPNFFMSWGWNDPRPSYLVQALAYDLDIEKQDPDAFIKYYLQQKKYKNAVHLMQFLTDEKKILSFILEVPETERGLVIEKDTQVAAVWAKYLIEKKQYSRAKFFYSNIEMLNPSAAFSLAIDEQDYVYAYDLFKRLESTHPFSMKERKTLAKIFFDEAEKNYDSGKICRESKRWSEAEPYYCNSLAQKKAAAHLNPTKEYLENVYTHKRLYALLLIDTDIELYEPAESNIAEIQKAILLLRECSAANGDELQYRKLALARGLMRRIDTLRENMSFTYSRIDLSDVTAQVEKHGASLSALIAALNEVITLLEGTKDNDLRLKLGKAHYLLADVQEFFNVNAPDINHHYKMAWEIVPENPFYALRLTEVFEEYIKPVRGPAVTSIKTMGYTVFDYVHWCDERWVKRKDIIHDIKDIHELPIESSTKKHGWSLSS